MEIHIYDFDGTLFRSPAKPLGWPDSSWWAHPGSLDEPCVPEIPGPEWWISSTVAQARRSIADPNVWAVLATGRLDNVFRWRVPELLKQAGLNFDEVHLAKGSTLSFKQNLILKLLRRFPDVTHVQMWDDRKSHISAFDQMFRKLDIPFEIHVVEARLMPCEQEPQQRQAGDVVPLFQTAPARPKGKTMRFKGHVYALSTFGGPLGDMIEDMVDDDRIIRGPVRDPWKFLWAYDTDKDMIAMWRVTDGNEKAGGASHHYHREIMKLEKLGQLNRVSHQEFQALEAEMRKRERAVLRSLEQSVELSKDDYQRVVDEAAWDVFRRDVEPGLQRRIKEVLRGVHPFGFEVDDRIVDYSPPLEQAVVHVISEEMRKFTVEKIEEEIRNRGYNPDDSAHDIQAAYWAHGDVTQAVWVKFKGEAKKKIRRMATLSHTFTFTVGEPILYGKWKNKRGIIKNIGTDAKGNPIILVEPVPLGRKKPKVMGLFKVWKAPSVEVVASRYLARR